MRETEREQTENLSESGHTLVIEGRNAVIEAFRSGRTIDKADARTARSARSCGKPKSTVRS